METREGEISQEFLFFLITLGDIDAIGPACLSSRRGIFSSTSFEKASVEIDQVDILGSTGEKREVERLLPEMRDLWTPRGGFEPPYYALLYFESSVPTFFSKHGDGRGGVTFTNSIVRIYLYPCQLLNRIFISFLPDLLTGRLHSGFNEVPGPL